MKFKIQKSDLLGPVANVAKCAKGVMSTSSSVKIVAESDKVVFTGNSFELAGQFMTSTVTIHKTGECLVDSRMLHDFVKSLPAGEVSFDLKGNVLQVKYGNGSQIKFNTLSETDFVDPEFEGKLMFAAKSGEIFKALKSVAYATAVPSSTFKEIFKGILIEPGEDKSLFLVASDSFRMAWAELPLECQTSEQMIVPPTLVGLVGSVFQSADELKFKNGGNKLIVEGENAVISTALINGSFPQWKSILQAVNSPTIIEGSTEIVNAALSRIRLMADKKSPSVQIAVEGNQMTLRTSSDVGEIAETVEVKASGSEFSGPVNFNPSYLAEALNASEDKEIEIRITGGSRPMCLSVGSVSSGIVIAQARATEAQKAS